MAEPEITPRKLLIAVTCLVGAAFIPYVQAIIAPLMMLPMTGEFGWTRTQYALATTFMFVSGALTVLIFGRIADRHGPRSILLTGAVCGGATMLLLSRQDAQLWKLYLAYALLGGFGASGLGYTKIIGSLFARHRGKALAIFGAESTIALAALPLLTNSLNTQLGWRSTYVFYGIVMFALSPVLYYVLRGPGLSAPLAGAEHHSASTAPAAVATTAVEGLTPAQIRRDRIFWCIVLAAVCGRGLYVGLTAHVIAAITDKGFTPTVAARAFSAATFVGLAGTAVAGFVMDYFRTAKFMIVFSALNAVGIFLFAMASASVGGLPLLIAGIALQSAAGAAMIPGTTYLQTRFVGMRYFGEAFAMFVVVTGIAYGVTPALFALIFDKTGSYALVYWIMIGGAAAGAALYMTMGPYRFRADTRSAR
ncbi:MAG TPA: MFS transporter [Steroidobacteraceae bacterium]|nr:MFS transporter [Steroidobacteraceae bacterium]